MALEHQKQRKDLEETHDMAICIANQVSICACPHCSEIYGKARDDYLLARAREKCEREHSR